MNSSKKQNNSSVEGGNILCHMCVFGATAGHLRRCTSPLVQASKDETEAWRAVAAAVASDSCEQYSPTPDR